MDVLEEDPNFSRTWTSSVLRASIRWRLSVAIAGLRWGLGQSMVSTQFSNRCTRSGFPPADSLRCRVGAKVEEVDCSHSLAEGMEGLGVGRRYTLLAGCHLGQQYTISEQVGVDVRVWLGWRGTIVLLRRGAVVVWGRRTVVVWWKVATTTRLLASPVPLSREEGHDSGSELFGPMAGLACRNQNQAGFSGSGCSWRER